MPHTGQWKGPRLILTTLVILITALSGTYLLFEKINPHIDTYEELNALQGVVIGQHRPEFVLPDMAGRPRNVNEWDNQVLIVNFWATWCLPCRREIPLFTRLQEIKGPSGLQFIGIAIDDKPAVDTFISDLEEPVNYPILVGRDDAINIAKQYGNEFGVLPYSVIIDRTGQIAYIQYGEFTPSELEEQIDSLL